MAQPVHLVVAVHGLWGGPENLDFLCDALVEQHGGTRAPAPPPDPAPSKGKGTVPGASPPTPSTPRRVPSAAPDASLAPRMVVLNSSVNRWVNTYDGIDWCAERVIREVDKEINRIHAWATPTAAEDEPTGATSSSSAPSSSSHQPLQPDVRHTVTHLSIIGYSLGGLIARYVVGALYGRGFFKTPGPSKRATSAARPVVPVNFITLATPHIGIPPTDTLLGTTLASLGKVALGRTGQQLYCADREWGSASSPDQQEDEAAPLLGADPAAEGRPLLEAMADPHAPFFKALALFRNKVFYGSAKHDLTVPFRTALLELEDPFANEIRDTVQMTFVHGYPHLIDTYAVLPPSSSSSAPPSSLPAPPPVPSTAWDQIRSHICTATGSIASASRKAIKAVVRPLMFFRPSRFPFRFPLNYLASALAPIAFPLLLVYMMLQTTSYARASVERITNERRAWAVTYAGSGAASPPDDAGTTRDALLVLDQLDTAQLERNRIAQILFGVGMALEEGDGDGVGVGNEDEDGDDDGIGDGAKDTAHGPGASSANPGAAAATDAPSEPAAGGRGGSSVPIFSTRQVDWAGPLPASASSGAEREPAPRAAPPLTQAQQRMVKHLRLVPGLYRRAAYFEGTFNAHSVIIVRRPHLPANQLGVDVVRHVAASFQVQ